MSSVGDFPGVDSWGPHSSLERGKKIRRRLFTSSIKLAFRHFHVEVTTKKGTKKRHARELNKPIAFFDDLAAVAVFVAKAPQLNGKDLEEKPRRLLP